MAIEIRQEEQGDVRVLALSGRLDTETSADLELALADLQAAGATRFLIDMADIGYVSSAGLRVLLALAKQLEGGRGTLKLCALNDSVRQVFDVAGFSRLFAIFPDRAAALGAAAQAAAKAKPRDDLARRAAGLLGAGEPAADGAAGPDAERLARAAAQLLGVDKPAPKAAPAPAKPKPAAKPEPAPANPAPAPAEAPGVLGRFRSLFGKK